MGDNIGSEARIGGESSRRLCCIHVCIIASIATLVLAVYLTYMPMWLFIRLVPELKPFTRHVAEVLMLTYILALAIGSVLTGSYFDTAIPSRKTYLVGGIGLAITLIATELVSPLNIHEAIIAWICFGMFTAVALFSTLYLLKTGVHSWNRGRVISSGFAIGAFFNIFLYHSLGSIREIAFLQAGVLVVTSSVLYLSTNKLPSKVIDSVHVRDFRLYLFMIPTFVFAMLLGYLFRVFVITGKLHMIFSTMEYVNLLSLPFLFALASGYIMDKYGRKEAGIVGYIILLLGSFTLLVHSLLRVLERSHIASAFTFALLEVGYGFMIPYFMVVWSDIPRKNLFGRVFTLGMLTGAAGVIAGVLITTLIGNADVALSIITSMIIPTSYIIFKLPETLPQERLMREEIRRYLKKALEVARRR